VGFGPPGFDRHLVHPCGRPRAAPHRLLRKLRRGLEADLLFVKQDRAEVLVVVPLRLALEIAKAAERRGGDKQAA